jgi:drug/metabolite transporter (DMT)-like permease
MINLLFLFCIIVLSQAGTLIRFAEADSLSICFWRLLIAASLMFPLAFLHRRSLRTLNKGDWMSLGLTGFFLFAHFYFFFRAVQETTVAVATMLLSLSPVITAIGAYVFFHERISLHLALACSLGISGIAALFGENLLNLDATHQLALRGDLWGVLSAAFMSGYILVGKHVRTRLANTVFACAIYFQTAIYAMVAMWIWQVPFTGYSQRTWVAFVALAVLPTLMGHAIFTYCLNHLNVNFMSCMTLVEPLLAAIAAHYLFAEKLTPFAGLGFLLTSASVVALYWEPLLNYLKCRGTNV